MDTYKIKVLVPSFPSYAPILEWYNANKPNEWAPIKEAGICEGGFEVPLSEAELERMKQRYNYLDANQRVRQLEWRLGELRRHHGYAALYEEEILLLSQALQAVLGHEKVEVTKAIY